VRLRDRLLGTRSFSRRDLARLLGNAGFNGFQTLHEHGPWMIVVASRPA